MAVAVHGANRDRLFISTSDGDIDLPVEMDLIREVGSREGFFLDPVYTGKAFYGLLDRIRQGIVPLASRVLFLHTGGLSGLFQYEEEVHRHLAGTD